MKTLINIQNELKAPKNQFNSFGEFHYRSCEDILEAVKPLLFKYGAALILSDEVVLIGNRYYVKATATLLTSEGGTFKASAYAREMETRKKMDDGQLTGAASSYARKYALNGLFDIDDAKDADARDNRDLGGSKPADKPAEKSAKNIDIDKEMKAATTAAELQKMCRLLLNTRPELKEKIKETYNKRLKEITDEVAKQEKANLGIEGNGETEYTADEIEEICRENAVDAGVAV